MFAMCLCLPASACAQHQTAAGLPEAPMDQNGASLNGTVEDEAGSLLPSAHVELWLDARRIGETVNRAGEFHVSGLKPGTYKVHVVAEGFDNGDEVVVLQEREQREMPPIELKMTADSATVHVVASMKEIAAEQVTLEEKQRVFGVLPNFYVAYFEHPAPLNAKQKFHLAWRSTLDPVTFLATAAAAGIEQASDEFPGYGQGADGYAKRYGAAYADGAVSTFLGGAILPSLFHQDPRYFYQGSGTFTSRAKHAVSSVFVCKGDNGRTEFNVSNILGNFAAAGISNAYYPDSDRHGAGLTMRNAAVGTAFGMFGALMQEFVVPHLTPHLPAHGKAGD